MTTPMPTSQFHHFEVDPAILRNLIEHQATSLERAVAEAVMNAIDAQASRVDIHLTEGTITIQDDGRGLQNADEIRKYFAVFGFDHTTQEEAGRRQYGQFGMGRGQLFKFGKVTWHTGRHVLKVDIREHGLAYEHTQSSRHVQGVEITCQLYEKLLDYRLTYLRQGLAKTFMLTQSVTLMFNGEALYSPVDWTFEDDTARYKAGNYGRLLIFNGEVLIEDNAKGDGIIQTKTPQATNLTRTELLPEVSGPLRSQLRKLNGERVKTKRKLSEADKKLLIGDLMERPDPNHTKYRLITDIGGMDYTLQDFMGEARRRGVVTVADDAGSVYGDKAHQQLLAFVLHPDTLSRFDCRDLLTLRRKVDTIGECQSRYYRRDHNIRFIDDLKEAVPDLKSEYLLIPRSEWTAAEKLILGILECGMSAVVKATYQARPTGSGVQNTRELLVGQASHAEAWTNGRTFVAFDRVVLADAAHKPAPGYRGQGLAAQGLLRAMHILLHEFCHTRDSTSGVHDQRFYQHYHDASMSKVFQKGLEDVMGEYHRLKEELAQARRDDSAEKRKRKVQ